MSWHYLQGQAGESSEACCSDGEPWQPSKLKLTHERFCCNGRLTESYLASLSGTMCAPSKGNHGADGSMLSAADSPARISVLPEKELESMANGADCGKNLRELSVKYDRNTSLWKTHRLLFDEVLPWCSVTLPSWGMMQHGVCWELMTPVLPIAVKESGLKGSWATPAASDGTRGGTITAKMSGRSLAQQINTPQTWPTPKANDAEKRGNFDMTNPRNGLPAAVKMWPTPKASAAGADFAKLNRSGTGLSLQTAVALFPTPTSSMLTAADMEQAKYHSSNRPAYRECFPTPTANEDAAGRPGSKMQKMLGNHPAVRGDCSGGSLNPNWVEWLMGWPIGWTDLKPLEMDRFRQWLRLHGKIYQTAAEPHYEH
jgi:hypothetical protein